VQEWKEVTLFHHRITRGELLTVSISKMIETVTLLKDEGIKAKIIVGGGILSEESCKQIGADDWTKDGWEGVKKIIKLLEGRKNAI